MRKRKIKRKNRSLISQLWKIGLAVLVVLLILDVYLLIDSKILNIKILDVVLDKISCTSGEEIRKESQILGKKFFLVDQKKIEQNLKQKFLCIKSVTVSKGFLDTVTVEVSGREPVAVLALLQSLEATPSGLENLASQSTSVSAQEKIESEFLVDREGVVLLKEHRDNLPVIYFGGVALDVGKSIGEGLMQNTLIILEKMKTFGIEIEEAKIYSQEILLINPVTQKPRIIFALNKNIDIQLASLQLILARAKIDMEEMEFVDLRFDKPIVKYVPKKK